MNPPVHFSSTIRRWTGGNGGSWFLVDATGEAAEQISGHALMRRLEEGRRRGFGSVKVSARTGNTVWSTSVFPQNQGEWVMLLKAEVRQAEGLSEGDEVEITLDLL